MPVKSEKQNVSLTGEFFVLAQLTIRNMIATLTLGHTKGVDILLANPKTGKLFKVEVKTTTSGVIRSKIFGNNYEWMMGEKHEEIKDPSLYYCFVLLEEVERLPKFFVVPSKDVAKYVTWEHLHWCKQPRKRLVKKDTQMRIFRIDAQKTSEYENAWHVFET
ncbi:hypothetical protein KJ766_04100 [Patescibacteria group bacterium]|nr:hypothetical protein [Patescibacteria group bacterium]